MGEIFLVFQGGGSDETLLGVFATMQAAEKAFPCLSRTVVTRYVLQESGEYEPIQ